VSIWSDIPWAVVHHHFWSPLNGALFTAKDILGNVKIAGNHIIDAYNGIRVRLSEECLASPHCRDRANSGFEIVGNTFEKIRDNAVEPEGRAEYWIIKHNAFLDVYAAISTDGVAGRDFLVFGNVFALDDTPGSGCRDQGWAGSRQFRLALGGGGRWSTAPAEGDDALCSTHALGTVIKMGVNEQAPDWPVLDRVHFFNNSLRTRSPLFRGALGPRSRATTTPSSSPHAPRLTSRPAVRCPPTTQAVSASISGPTTTALSSRHASRSVTATAGRCRT
jgi:hypothetical protein